MSHYLDRAARPTFEHRRPDRERGRAARTARRRSRRSTFERRPASWSERVDCGGLYIFIGADAETGWLPPEIALDQRGYVLTGTDVTRRRAAGSSTATRTCSRRACPGIFACGDVRSGPVKRVAAAVGEGSMAIAFVHQYLREQEPVARSRRLRRSRPPSARRPLGHRHERPLVRADVELPRARDLLSRSFSISSHCAIQPGQPAEREEDREVVGRVAHRLVDQARVEVDVRVELAADEVLVLERDPLQLERDLELRVDARLGEDLVGDLLDQLRARVVALVDAVPEAHQARAGAAVLDRLDEGRDVRTSPISSSIRSTASLAPPCSGP